jgi:hypothetical protein
MREGVTQPQPAGDWRVDCWPLWDRAVIEEREAVVWRETMRRATTPSRRAAFLSERAEVWAGCDTRHTRRTPGVTHERRAAGGATVEYTYMASPSPCSSRRGERNVWRRLRQLGISHLQVAAVGPRVRRDQLMCRANLIESASR